MSAPGRSRRGRLAGLRGSGVRALGDDRSCFGRPRRSAAARLRRSQMLDLEVRSLSPEGGKSGSGTVGAGSSSQGAAEKWQSFYQIAWMHGCTDAWMHGCMEAWREQGTDWKRDRWIGGCRF